MVVVDGESRGRLKRKQQWWSLKENWWLWSLMVVNGKADVFYRESRGHLRGKWEWWLLTEKVGVVYRESRNGGLKGKTGGFVKGESGCRLRRM